MTALGTTAARPAVRIGPVLLYLLGLAGLAFSLTTLWLSMRVVMGIGGACASGGPYVPAVVCPDAVVALTPLSIFGLFIFGGLMAWGGAGVGGAWVALVALAWPALFLSLGWNFFEFGLWPPGGEGEIIWSWLFCAVVFFLMGGIPLLVGIFGFREAAGSHRTYAGGRIAVDPRGGLNALRQVRNSLEDAARVNVLREMANDQAGLIRQRRAGVADRLEHLARLHAAGDLTDAEFEAAKAATLGGAR
jgi:hypothetical protein